jgi:hypothetical protein
MANSSSLAESAIDPNYRRGRSLGLAFGASWLVVIGGGFAIASLAMIETSLTTLASIAMGIVVAVLVWRGVRTIRAAFRLPPYTRPPNAHERRMMRQFVWILGAEIVALAIVNPLLATHGRPEMQPAVSLIIVGLHFAALAPVFRVPRYYALGAVFCAVPMGVLALMPAGAFVGAALGLYVVPSATCGLAACFTGAANFWEAERLLGGQVPTSGRVAVAR